MSWIRNRTLASALVVTAAVTLVGCSADGAGTEQGTDVDKRQGTSATEERPDETDGGYVGPYDSEFYDTLAAYEGDEVTVFGEVDEVVSPTSFTIAGVDDTQVGPLLVVSLEATGGLEKDMPVSVTGTVHEAFDIAAVERRFRTELDDNLHSRWNGGPYIEALVIDLPGSAGG